MPSANVEMVNATQILLTIAEAAEAAGDTRLELRAGAAIAALNRARRLHAEELATARREEADGADDAGDEPPADDEPRYGAFPEERGDATLEGLDYPSALAELRHRQAELSIAATVGANRDDFDPRTNYGAW